MAGRPRDPQLETRLLGAAWQLLQERGYDALTLTQVAAEAGAHRTDVYRRWSSKAQLVTDVLAVHLPAVADRDTGTLLGDTRAYLDDLAAAWSAPWIDGLVGLLADLRRDADAELAFRVLAERRGQPMRNALERAVARGEIDSSYDRHVVSDFLEGALMHRRMIALLPLTPEYLDAVAQGAYRVLTASVVTS
jgi:AcrR family transcriptional regulator